MKIGAIIGSLRKDSFNRKLYETTKELMPKGVEMFEIRIDDIPFMNQDIEYPAPPAVTRMREEFRNADAVWIFTPEYNHTYSAMIKNAIDWLSRPDEAGNKNLLAGKAMTYSGAGFGLSGTTSAQDELTKALGFLAADSMNFPRVTIPLMDKVDHAGNWHPDELTKRFIKDQVDAFVKFNDSRSHT